MPKSTSESTSESTEEPSRETAQPENNPANPMNTPMKTLLAALTQVVSEHIEQFEIVNTHEEIEALFMWVNKAHGGDKSAQALLAAEGLRILEDTSQHLGLMAQEYLYVNEENLNKRPAGEPNPSHLLKAKSAVDELITLLNNG